MFNFYVPWLLGMHWILPGVLQSRAVSPASAKMPRPFCLATFGRTGSRQKKRCGRLGFHEYVVPEMLQQICWNHRISFLPVQSFYLHFLTLCSDMAWLQRQAIKDSGEMRFPPLTIVDCIDFALPVTGQKVNSKSRILEANFVSKRRMWQVVWKNSLLRIQRNRWSVACYNMLTCSWGSACDESHSAPTKSDHVRFVCL